MPRKTMIEAIRDAMDIMMGRDDNVVVFGEDVGYFGGVSRATQGLQAKYGKSRCFDVDTAEKRLLGRLDALTHDVPPDFHERFEALVRAVTGEQARKAVRARFSAEDMQVVVVASAKDVAKGLEAIPGLASFEVVPFDREV